MIKAICVMCLTEYRIEVSKSHYRGTCGRACEKVLMNRERFDAVKHTLAESKKFLATLSKMRRETPGADKIALAPEAPR